MEEEPEGQTEVDGLRMPNQGDGPVSEDDNENDGYYSLSTLKNPNPPEIENLSLIFCHHQRAESLQDLNLLTEGIVSQLLHLAFEMNQKITK